MSVSSNQFPILSDKVLPVVYVEYEPKARDSESPRMPVGSKSAWLYILGRGKIQGLGRSKFLHPMASSSTTDV